VSHRRKVYCAPSWSWASVTGSIEFAREAFEIPYDYGEVTVHDIKLKLLGSDPTVPLQSGSLLIEGPLLTAALLEEGPLEWRLDKSKRCRIHICGADVNLDISADACLTNSEIADLGPAPFELSLDEVSSSSQSQQVEEGVCGSITAHLLCIQQSFGIFRCLWLRATGRAEGEF